MRHLIPSVVVFTVSCCAWTPSACAGFFYYAEASASDYEVLGRAPLFDASAGEVFAHMPITRGGASATAMAFATQAGGSRLRTFASVHDSEPVVARPSTNFPQRGAGAKAGYVDDVTITSWNPWAMYATLDIRVHGTLAADRTSLNGAGGGVASYGLDVGIRNQNPIISEHFGNELGLQGDATSASESVDFTRTYLLPLGYFQVSVYLSSEARTYWGQDPFQDHFPYGSATSGFFQTVSIGNLRVLDASGSPVDFTYITGSGTDLTGPVTQDVPEPSSGILAVLGICSVAAVGWFRRRSARLKPLSVPTL